MDTLRKSPMKSITEENAKLEIVNVPIERVHPMAGQPRTLFDPMDDAEFLHSIQTHGMLEPIIVRPKQGANDVYEIVCGHRRRKAAHELGFRTVPCVVVQYSDEDARVIAMTENLARSSFWILDEALGYKRLLQESGQKTQNELARSLGVSESRICQFLKIANLPEHLLSRIRKYQNECFERGKDVDKRPYRVTERHLRWIVRLDDMEDQWDVVDRMFSEEMSSRNVEMLVNSILNGRKKSEVQSKTQRKLDLSHFLPGIKLNVTSKTFSLSITHEMSLDSILSQLRSLPDALSENDLLHTYFEKIKDFQEPLA